jgi:hypothetical protein
VPIHIEGAARSSDQPTETQGNGGDRVGIAFDVVADCNVEGSGHRSDRDGRVFGRVHGSTIQLLDAPFGFPHFPPDSRLRITGGTPEALLHFLRESWLRHLCKFRQLGFSDDGFLIY